MLEVKNLVCGYDNFLLKDISFKVNSSELVGIIGPNGSGKTTLIRAITKLVKPKYIWPKIKGIFFHNYYSLVNFFDDLIS